MKKPLKKVFPGVLIGWTAGLLAGIAMHLLDFWHTSMLTLVVAAAVLGGSFGLVLAGVVKIIRS